MKYPDISYLRFLTLDLFVDGNMKKKYNMKNCDRDTVFDHIVRVADNLFDVVRHHFFMQWEPDKDGNIAANVPFENVVAIKLINQVFPFWIGERFWMPEITPPANIPV